MKKNNFKQQLVRLFTVLTIAGTFALTAAAQTHRCNLHSLSGSYGANITGTFFLSPTMPVPLASVGIETFDGAGNSAGSGTTSFNGMVSSGTDSGVYTVERNCTGTLTVTFSNGFVITNNFVLVDGGKELFIIQTTTGTVISGVMKRQ